jgi:hypothetical protein
MRDWKKRSSSDSRKTINIQANIGNGTTTLSKDRPVCGSQIHNHNDDAAARQIILEFV